MFSRVLHLVTVTPERPMNEDILYARRGYCDAGDTSCAIAQMKPTSSRAIAVAAFGFAFPRATSCRKRVVKRSWAFHAMSQATLGNASWRYACCRPIRGIPDIPRRLPRAAGGAWG